MASYYLKLRGISALSLLFFLGFMFSPRLFAQVTVATGSIEVTVTDSSDALVTGAKISVENQNTGQVIKTATSSVGTSNISLLIPGQYKVNVEAQGFQPQGKPVVVQVGTVTPVVFKLSISADTQVVEVSGTQIQVNTEQSSLHGVLT